jgi:hypothetical protein
MQRAIADSLYAVDLAGNLRLVARFPGTMVLTVEEVMPDRSLTVAPL